MSAVLVTLVVLLQVASGSLWWALAVGRRRVSVFELLGVGTALGVFAGMLTGILLVATPVGGWGFLLPALASIPLAWLTRHRLTALEIAVRKPEGVAVALGALAGLAITVLNWRRIPLDNPTSGGFADLNFFEAIGRGLATWGPHPSILMSSGSLRYHWFTYAWSGQVERFSSAEPYLILTRVLPLVVMLGVVCLAASWAGRLSSVRWVPTLSVLLIVVGGYLGALYGVILNYDSPSQSMTTLFLLALTVALTAYVAGELPSWALVLIAGLAAACTGGKVSHAVVAAAGICVMVIGGVLTRRAWLPRAAAAAVVCGIAIVATYVIVLAGVAVDSNLTGGVDARASTWQGLDPIVGPAGVMLGTAALTLAVLARVAGMAWLIGRRETRWEPGVLYATGALLAGFAAMIVLSDGVNSLWFILAASAPASVLSAVGCGQALSWARLRAGIGRPALLAVGVSLPGTIAALALSRNWGSLDPLLHFLAPVAAWALIAAAALVTATLAARSHRLRAASALALAGLAVACILTRPAALWTSTRNVNTEGGVVTPGDRPANTSGISAVEGSAVTPAEYADQRAAADWLAANLPAGAIVATSTPVSALVPALAGTQMYLAGARYQAGLGSQDELADVSARTAQSVAFGERPSTVTAAPLCAAGVDFVWLDVDRTPSTLPADVVYSNDTVSIVHLSPDACT